MSSSLSPPPPLPWLDADHYETYRLLDRLHPVLSVMFWSEYSNGNVFSVAEFLESNLCETEQILVGYYDKS